MIGPIKTGFGVLPTSSIEFGGVKVIVNLTSVRSDQRLYNIRNLGILHQRDKLIHQRVLLWSIVHLNFSPDFPSTLMPL
jgi:hypothetical protein